MSLEEEEALTKALKMAARRSQCWNKQICVNCGAAVSRASFRDQASLREYGFSALCQNCQDTFFGSDE